eukprot:GHVS01053090.1.p1 GENE.GHVS01053090.1~~GHVS01053090.1.p1  ORF type:complete len:298 (-),score=30.03 GHVS01053090.1:54-947(-)
MNAQASNCPNSSTPPLTALPSPYPTAVPSLHLHSGSVPEHPMDKHRVASSMSVSAWFAIALHMYSAYCVKMRFSDMKLRALLLSVLLVSSHVRPSACSLLPLKISSNKSDDSSLGDVHPTATLVKGSHRQLLTLELSRQTYIIQFGLVTSLLWGYVSALKTQQQRDDTLATTESKFRETVKPDNMIAKYMIILVLAVVCLAVVYGVCSCLVKFCNCICKTGVGINAGVESFMTEQVRRHKQGVAKASTQDGESESLVPPQQTSLAVEEYVPPCNRRNLMNNFAAMIGLAFFLLLGRG